MPEKCAFALDGVRLVDNLGPLEEYQYETAQGFILVKKHMSGENVAYFTVAYPNGNTATFGFTDNKDMQVVYPITELCDSKGFRIDFSYEDQAIVYILQRYNMVVCRKTTIQLKWYSIMLSEMILQQFILVA